MREIKFRQPILSFGKFCSWHYWGFIDSKFVSPGHSSGRTVDETQEKSQQYTGLKDKNGKEIYEGDIVHYDTEDGIVTALVEWKESEDEDKHISGFVYKPLTCDDYPADTDEPVGFEVIGNIYENPELAR